MRATRISLLVLISAAFGCGELGHGDYIDARASAECKNYRSCAKGFFESEFRDYDDCVKERADYLDEIDDNLPRSCDYDGVEGRQCVSRLNSMGCEEFTEESGSSACDLVWDCNG